jgi:Asp-tRNA(Asn)/Glu-tRNA(Gln) amidotransferase A subunit family amidase
VFTAINPGLMHLANTIDHKGKKSRALTPLAGIPIALKDLFNIRTEVTLAGSIVRKHYAQAEDADATFAPRREYQCRRTAKPLPGT